MKTWLKLFFKWWIQFEDAYSIEEKSERKVQYADYREVEAAVLDQYPPKVEVQPTASRSQNLCRLISRRTMKIRTRKKSYQESIHPRRAR